MSESYELWWKRGCARFCAVDGAGVTPYQLFSNYLLPIIYLPIILPIIHGILVPLRLPLED